MIKFQIAGFRSLKRWKILKEQSSTLKEPQSVHSGNMLQQLICCRHNVVSTLPICMLSIALNNDDISIGDRYASTSVEKLTITQLCYLHIEYLRYVDVQLLLPFPFPPIRDRSIFIGGSWTGAFQILY